MQECFGEEDCIPFFLTDTRVHSNGGEVAFAQKLVKLSGSESALDEDDDLIELEGVKKIIQLAVLLRLIKLQAVLLQTM